MTNLSHITRCGLPEADATAASISPSGYESLLDLTGDLMDALPAAVYVCDAAGLIVRCNRKAVEHWGRTPKLGDTEDRFCGSWRLYRLDGGPLPHDQCPMADVLRTGQAVHDQEVVIERADGSRITALININALRNAAGAIVGAVNCFQDITERKQAEERAKLLAREVDHRAKNMLTVVQAIARMTKADTVPAFVEALTGRLDALSRAHTLLAESRWTSADLKRLVEEELAAYRTGEGGRVKISGPALALSPDAAQALAMTLHELATNAAKYGALSTPDGRVAVAWSWDSGKRLVLRWTETGGPPVRRPPRQGFGTVLVEMTINAQLDGAVQLDWPAEGLACRMTIPREKLLDGTGHASGS